MRSHSRVGALLVSGLAAAAGTPGAAQADVTIEHQTTFDLGLIKAHGTDTEYTTADKQRRDNDLHCEGLMSLACGNAQTGEIIRLDRDLTWSLEPKKKEYRETPFLTPAQRQAAEREAQAMMEKIKQCPAVQHASTTPDTSKCEMSTPKFEVKQTGTHTTIAGHDAQLTQLAMTQSCRNKETGDVCDYLYSLDAWLTQDQIAGVDEPKAFEAAYLKKLGVTASDAVTQKQLSKLLAPYKGSLKELSGKAGELKGYPLKTAVRFAFGGEHCAAAKGQAQTAGGSGGNVVGEASQAAGNAATSSASGAAGSAAGAAATNAAGGGAAGSVLGSAASAFSNKLVSGLFAKKNSGSGTSGTASTAATNSGLPPGMVQFVYIGTETTSISTAAVPAAQFDVPAGWKLIQPQEDKTPKEFTCPASGS